MLKKIREAFAVAPHILLTKNIGIFEKLTFENLTKRLLTTLLVLNNQAHVNNGPASKLAKLDNHSC